MLAKELCTCLDIDSGSEALYLDGELIHSAGDIYLSDLHAAYQEHCGTPVVLTRFEFDGCEVPGSESDFPWPQSLDELKKAVGLQ